MENPEQRLILPGERLFPSDRLIFTFSGGASRLFGCTPIAINNGLFVPDSPSVIRSVKTNTE
jgi:hypothetical protein